MALKYVLNSMKRRKLRTIIVALALIVGVALVGALLALVDTQRQYALQQVGDQTGGFDLNIKRSDLALSPFFDPITASTAARGANSRLAAIYQRIQGSAVARTKDSVQDWNVTVVGLDMQHDGLNRVKPVTEGTYPPKAGQVFLASLTADLLHAKVGDEIKLSYVQPIPRESGKTASANSSTARAEGKFVVAGVGIISGLSDATNTIFMTLADAQTWLNQPDKVERLLVVWNSDDTAGSDSKLAVSNARDSGELIKDAVQKQLGNEYLVALPKYASLDAQAQGFVFQQSFITIYGLMSMGIIGLMVNALMMTTVQEQKRDLAVLRVLGAARTRLFEAVVLEVVILGTLGVVVGVLLGRVLSDRFVAPLLLQNLDLPAGVSTAWTLRSVLTPTIITVVVLALATFNPARQAASTKVMIVLNPSAADQPTLDDIAKLRERKPQIGLVITGVVLLIISFCVLFLFPLLFSFGDLNFFANVYFGALMLMVMGMSLIFYFVTTPIERVLLFLYGVISNRASYFASRYSLRGKGRNALISLMVVASAVLPCLLAAQLVVSDANLDTDLRFSNGTDAIASVGGPGFGPPGGIGGGFNNIRVRGDNMSDDNLHDFSGHPGVQNAVAIANGYIGDASDRVNLRSRRARFIGVSGDLTKVLYPEFYKFNAGDASALVRVANDPNVVIISAAMQDALDVKLGDGIKVKGNGQDHERIMQVIAIGARIPGFAGEFTSNRNAIGGGATGLMMSMAAYRDLRNDPAKGPPDATEALYTKVYVHKIPGVNDNSLGKALRDTFSRQKGLNIVITSEQIDQTRDTLQQGRVITLVLTALSMITAVFGVLAVMYTAVLGRRVEIGMLKAIGSPAATLRGIFIGEAMVTTLAAAIAGIIAGTLLGMLFVFVERFNSENPTLWAFDFQTAGAICAMVMASAILSAWLATRPVLRQKAVMVLRER